MFDQLVFDGSVEGNELRVYAELVVLYMAVHAAESALDRAKSATCATKNSQLWSRPVINSPGGHFALRAVVKP